MANKTDSNLLFPILGDHPATGLARLATEATPAGEGHRIEFRAMTARSILNKSVSRRNLSLAYSINPYRGCEFGCRYCYARYTHEFLRPEPVAVVPRGAYDVPQQSWALAFEREIYLKENAAWLLDQELGKIDPRDEIAIGTATDPYQPVERRVGITRSLLEVFAQREGYRLGIVTKSSLITRDIDLFVRIAERNRLVLHVTITTADAGLARKIEPRAPRPDLRFSAVKKLRRAGLRAGVLCCPLLPGINDSMDSLDAVAGCAARAKASFLGANPLFLKSCSRPTWMSFVREHFPDLAEDYGRRFATADFAAPEYRRQMAARVRQVCRKYGIGERSSGGLTKRDIVLPPDQVPAQAREAPSSRRPSAREIPAQTRLFA